MTESTWPDTPFAKGSFVPDPMLAWQEPPAPARRLRSNPPIIDRP